MMLIPAIRRQPAADLLGYAQEAVTIGCFLIAEGERQDGELRLPILRHPGDAAEKQTPFQGEPSVRSQGVRPAGPPASVLIAHQPKHASQRQNRGRKRKKLPCIRGCKIDADFRRFYRLLPYPLRSAMVQGCPYIRTIVNFVMAVTACVAEPGTCLQFLSQIRGFEMGNEASPRLSIEDRKQIAGGLFFVDDASVREPAFVNQLQNVDNHLVELTSRVRKLPATCGSHRGVRLLTFAGPRRS